MHMVAPTVDLAVALSNHSDVRVHQYHFTAHDSYHSVELNYVFGAPFSGVFADEMSGGHGKNFSERDRAHSRFMMRLWTNFAKFRCARSLTRSLARSLALSLAAFHSPHQRTAPTPLTLGIPKPNSVTDKTILTLRVLDLYT